MSPTYFMENGIYIFFLELPSLHTIQNTMKLYQQHIYSSTTYYSSLGRAVFLNSHRHAQPYYGDRCVSTVKPEKHTYIYNPYHIGLFTLIINEALLTTKNNLYIASKIYILTSTFASDGQRLATIT